MLFLLQLSQLCLCVIDEFALRIVLNDRLVGEGRFHAVFFFAIAFTEIEKALHRRRRAAIAPHDFFESVSGRGIFFLLEIESCHVEIVFREVLDALGELLLCLSGVG